jgi:hypothetical protein
MPLCSFTTKRFEIAHGKKKYITCRIDSSILFCASTSKGSAFDNSCNNKTHDHHCPKVQFSSSSTLEY